MRALSLTQPWAWLVVRPDITDPLERAALRPGLDIKPLENRGWKHAPKFRGDFLVHAAQGMSALDYERAYTFARGISEELARKIPTIAQLQRGGIIGAAELYDVLERTTRPHVRWHMWDQHGLLLRNARPLPFLPCKGMQRWWGNFEIRDGKAVQL